MIEFSRLFIDTTPLIYYVEKNPEYYDILKHFFMESYNAEKEFVSSVVTVHEYSVHPYMYDEVQYVSELFRYIKLEIDKDRHPGMFFLTGSQQFKLHEEASESLAGRVGVLSLYGLSSRELREDSFDKPFLPTMEYLQNRQNANLKDIDIWESIYMGFYPEVALKKVRRDDFYESYIKTYVERDIRKLTQVADELLFIQFIRTVAARTGSLINYSDIAKDIGISEVTAKKWLSLLVSSGIVYLLQPFSLNVEKRVVKTPKLYFMDTGLAAYLTGWTSPDVIRDGAMAGAFFETYVIGEIVKSYTNAGLNPPIYFYRDKDKIEIDLMIYLDNTIYPIEIKKRMTPDKKDAKNFNITGRIKNTEVKNGIIICNCDEPVSVREGVLAIPVRYI